MLELSFLGPPRILIDQTPIGFESRKAVALLAYLASMSGVHTRAEIAALLWPESDSRRARGALRYTLSLLRTSLGAEWFDITRQEIGLNEAASIQIDVRQFRHLLRKAHNIEKLEAALALYRDDFLTGFTLRDSPSFDEWHFFQQENLRQELADLLAHLVRAYAAGGDYDRAILYARRLLQRDVLREDFQRELMQLLAASGQSAAAIHQYTQFTQILDRELGVAPSPATQDLYRRIAASEEQPPVSTPRKHTTNLPTAIAALIGRDAELSELHALLEQPDCRLLTLIGPGGMGKTRLAQQIAHEYRQAATERFKDGIFYVPLASIQSRDLLIAAIAEASAFSFSGSEPPLEQLIGFLAEKRILLVLDNFEQLIPHAEFLTKMLTHAPYLQIVVTSRERLNLYDEWIYAIDGLDYPASSAHDFDTESAPYGAVQLFCRRARRVDPHFQPDREPDAIAEICRLVQGMPLGIELAAGWVRVLSCREIVGQIRRNYDFLVTEMQDVPSRHRSLRAVFRYSWQRLSSDERRVFVRLTVFEGGFSQEAAVAVTGASHLALARLIDKTMIQRNVGARSTSERFGIHELLRQFGWEELATDERAAIQAAHSAYFAQFLAARAKTRQHAAEALALAEIGIDIDNIVAAWNWLIDRIKAPSDGVSTPAVKQLMAAAPMLVCFFLRTCRFQEGIRLTEAALEALNRAPHAAPDDASGRTLLGAQLQLHRAEFLFSISDFTSVAAIVAEILPILKRLAGQRMLGEALWLAGSARVRMGRYDSAKTYLIKSLDTLRAAGEHDTSILALNGLGIWHSNQGMFAQARPYYEEFLSIARATGYGRGVANALNNLGSNYARAGDHDRALAYYRQSYDLALELKENLLIAVALSNLGSVSRALRRFDDALSYYARSLAITRSIGDRRWTIASLNGMGLMYLDMEQHQDARPLLEEALETALIIRSLPDALDALTSLADVLLNLDRRSEAMAVLRFVANHPATMSPARVRATARLQSAGGGDESVSALNDIQTVAEQVLRWLTSHAVSA